MIQDEQRLLARRLDELAARAEKRFCPVSGRFINAGDVPDARHAAREHGVALSLDGGWPEAERLQPCFHPEEEAPEFTGQWV